MADDPMHMITQELVVHYLEGGSVDDAVANMTDQGLPDEMAKIYPGMIYDCTSAAVSILQEEQTLEEVVAEFVAHGVPQEDATNLVVMVQGIIQAYAFGRQAIDEQEGDRPGDAQLRAVTQYMVTRYLEGATRDDMIAMMAENSEHEDDFATTLPEVVEYAASAAMGVYQGQHTMDEAIALMVEGGIDEPEARLVVQTAHDTIGAYMLDDEDDDDFDDDVEVPTTPFAPDFSTPQAAIASLEDAYRRRDLDAVMMCKDFTLEAGFIVNRSYGTPAYDALLLMNKGLVEAHFQQQLDEQWPNFHVPTEVVGIEELPGDMVIVTEEIRPPNHDVITNQLFVGKSADGWKVLMPYDDDMRDAWIAGQTHIATHRATNGE